MEWPVLTLQALLFAASLVALLLGTLSSRFLEQWATVVWSAFVIQILWITVFVNDKTISYLVVWSGLGPLASLLLGLLLGSAIAKLLEKTIYPCFNERGITEVIVRSVIQGLIGSFTMSYAAFWLDGSEHEWDLFTFYALWLLLVGIFALHIATIVIMHRRGVRYVVV